MCVWTLTVKSALTFTAENPFDLMHLSDVALLAKKYLIILADAFTEKNSRRVT